MNKFKLKDGATEKPINQPINPEEVKKNQKTNEFKQHMKESQEKIKPMTASGNYEEVKDMISKGVDATSKPFEISNFKETIDKKIKVNEKLMESATMQSAAKEKPFEIKKKFEKETINNIKTEKTLNKEVNFS